MGDCYVGIDLGTTFSSAVVIKSDNRQEKIVIDGQQTMPSMVSYGNSIEVGIKARQQLLKPDNVKNVVYDSKRMLGKTYDEIKEEIQFWPFQVQKDTDGKPVIMVTYDHSDKKISPTEVSGAILDKIHKTIKEKGFNPKGVVITIPAQFDQKQEDEVHNAAKIAGFDMTKLYLFKEPSAAAVAYTQNIAPDKECNILIYDFGGGTFDVSLLKITPGAIDIIDHEGDSHLGGQDIDNAIVKLLREKISEKYNQIDLENLHTKYLLKDYAEKAKINLGGGANSDIIKLNIQGFDFEYNLRKREFEELIRPIVQKTIDVVKSVQEKHKDIKVDKFVLVGGSSLLKMVSDMMIEEFEEDRILQSEDRLTAVAIGAAYMSFKHFQPQYPEVEDFDFIPPKDVPKPNNTPQNVEPPKVDNKPQNVETPKPDASVQLLSGVPRQEAQIMVRDVIEKVSISYGVRIRQGGVYKFLKMIEKGTKLPTEPITKRFMTTDDNANQIDLRVFQGEDTDISKCKQVGCYAFKNLPQRPAGQVKVNVTLRINIQNSLEVKCQIVGDDGPSQDFTTVLNSETTMPQEKIDEARKMLNPGTDLEVEEDIGKVYDFIYERSRIARKQKQKDAANEAAVILELIEEYDENNEENKKREILQRYKEFVEKYPDICN